MAADASTNTASAGSAIRVEPLSPAVGLWVDGVDLHRLDGGSVAMIQDLWQLGGALLFRGQEKPVEAALRLASALANGPLAASPMPESGGVAAVTGGWSMPGATLPVPPKALVFAAETGLPNLMLAGMEAAADALRMEDPEFLAKIADARAAHGSGGPLHPVVHRHALNGETCLYVPPADDGSFPGSSRLLTYAEQARFCCLYEWVAGDVLAVDPRVVRCRWSSGRNKLVPAIVLAGAVPLSEMRSSFGDWR